ncbi:MAG: hypothetical protein MJH10_15325 [Epibacterium sp.]|nr:hypothetical protein [Epibacterium sp.]NQX74891.1 hypothetical protein [Epibacterium sp.]
MRKAPRQPKVSEEAIEQFAAEADQPRRKRSPWHGMDPDASRHKRGNPKAKAINLPLNEYEYARLNEAAKKAKRSLSDYMRIAIFDAVDNDLG